MTSDYALKRSETFSSNESADECDDKLVFETKRLARFDPVARIKDFKIDGVRDNLYRRRFGNKVKTSRLIFKMRRDGNDSVESVV